MVPHLVLFIQTVQNNNESGIDSFKYALKK